MQTRSANSTPALKITASQEFNSWLAQQNLSIACTTYQTNRLFFVSSQANDRLLVHERLFDKPMGLYAAGDRLYMTTRYQLWYFDNLLGSSQKYGQCLSETQLQADRLYVPRTAYTTGDVNAHEVVLDNAGKVIFVNTDFSCLATLSPDYNFVPIWQPPFISKLVAEDRCHLNGLAMVEGKPGYVTACSTTDTAAGWRNHRLDGGVVIDVNQNEIIATGLSMPHSPRWYQGKLWLLNSGTGELGYIEDRQFHPIIFCPGFVRGLAFWQNFAFVGLSQLRSQSFTGLTLEKRLIAEGNHPQCGLMVIDLQTGAPLHWLYFQGVIEELFDVVVLPGVRQPQAIGLQEDEIQRLVTFPNSGGIVTTKPTAHRPSLGTAPPVAGLPTQQITPLNPPLERGETGKSNSLPLERGEIRQSSSLPFIRGGLGRGNPNTSQITPINPPEDWGEIGKSNSLPEDWGEIGQSSSLPFIRGGLGWGNPKTSSEAAFSRGEQIRYQRVYHLNSSNALDYNHLTYPSLQKRWQTQPPQGELIGLSASLDGAIVGFAISERLNPQQAEIISLFVLPEYRCQGIGRRLVAYLERELAQQGCVEIILSYSTNTLTNVALEPLLQKLHWQPPQINLVLGKTATEKIAPAPWLNKYPLPPAFEVFPWLDAGLSLPPNVEAHRLEPLNSLGLRYRGEVIGWVLTHRVAPDTIRYTTVSIAQAFEKRGRGVSLLAEAIRRQVDSGVPYLTGSVSYRYPRLLQFVERHLTPYLTGVGEVRQTSKLINRTLESREN
ncbi:TIGR03032 family protein [Desmonostoc muscorum LEGE 12446]|uniref:TIGR03032 family protein n=1 Tax=Desmonostoc muscorum TaxID=1179 RepID=UPI001F38A48F|nr:TIGR03032 family protein [Desmonostoc muscorum]MCF2145974.1 TIGR03032 family protein [Desmonostoc muscorum LEGE 12446]